MLPWHGQQRSASAQGWLPAGTALRCAGKGSIIAALVLGLLIPYNGLAGADTQAPSAHAAPCSAAQRSSEPRIMTQAWGSGQTMGSRLQHTLALLPFFMAGLQLKRSSVDTQIVQVPRTRACVCARALARVRWRTRLYRACICAHMSVCDISALRGFASNCNTTWRRSEGASSPQPSFYSTR